jgi:hypothetical protein
MRKRSKVQKIKSMTASIRKQKILKRSRIKLSEGEGITYLNGIYCR